MTLLDALWYGGVGAATALYLSGRRHLPGRSRPRVAAFLAAMAVLVAATAPWLEERAAELFSMHMVQHLLLILIVSPLLVYARVGRTIRFGLPGELRRSLRTASRSVAPLAEPLRSPVVAGVVHVGVLWAWHLPGLYEAAVVNEVIHGLEHITFLGSAFLVWWVVIESGSSHFGRALFVFAIALQSGLLGALLLFAARPLYPIYLLGASGGVDPLTDQQLAGALMWIPTGVVYTVTVVALLMRGFRFLELSTALESPDA